MLQHNPQAINERGCPADGQSGWDKILLLFYTLLLILVYIVAGLDFRFNGDGVGPWLHLLASALIVARTALEDHTLQAELPGYKEYAQEVRWRLLPGVW